MLPLSAQIESILFWKGEPVAISTIAKILNITEEIVTSELQTLESSLTQRGIVLQRNNNEIALATHPGMSTIFETLTKEELSRDLGKAGLETLSIILYRGPVKRSEIDYIRGVNSQFILRNLLIRGLIERVTDPKDERSFLYKPTFELLSYLGVSKLEDLPEFEAVKQEIETHKQQKEAENKDKNPEETNEQ